MKKVLAAIVTFIFSVCLLSATVATASAASVKKVSGFKADVAPLTVTLSWKKTSGAKGYEIQQKSGKKWKTVATIKKVKTTSYTVKKLKNGTTYQFRIRAVNGKKKGAYVTVKAKTGVQKIASVKAVSAGLDSAKVTWAKGNVTGYEIQYSTSKKFTKKTTKTVKVKKAKTTSYTLKKLAAGTKNYIRIRGYVSGSAKTYYGAYTTVNVTPAVNPMGAVTVKGVTDTSVTVSWAKVSGVTGYQIQKLQAGKWVDVNTAVKNSVTQFNVTKLTSLADQQIRVRAYQKSGSKVFYNNWVTVKAKTNIGNASGVTVSAVTASSAKISWKAAGGAAAYRVFNGSTKIADVKTTSAVVTVKPATTYKITVVSYNGAVSGKATAAVSFTSACSKVTGLTAGAVTDSSVALSWTAVTGAKSYQLWYSKDGKNWSSTTSAAASATIKNLDANTAYTFKVSAINQNGGKNQYGENSDAVTARTSIGAVTGLKVSGITGTAATLTWNAARGAKSYRVYNDGALLAEVNATSATLNLNPATTYNVSVAGCDGSAEGASSEAVEFATEFFKKIDDVNNYLEWYPVEGAVDYEVQYYNYASDDWDKKLAFRTGGDTELNIESSNIDLYRVVAYDKDDNAIYTSKAVNLTSEAYTLTKDGCKITFKWPASAGASKYTVKRSSEDNSYVETKDFTGTTAEYILAPGLLHRFEVYTDKGTSVVKFAIETPKMDLGDTSDVAVNNQLAYLAEAINRSKYDYTHKTVINNVSEMNSNIGYMKFGMPGFKDTVVLGVTFDSPVTTMFKLAFESMLKGTNYKIADGYIECYDKDSVEALFGIMGEGGTGDNSATNIKEETVATFNKQIRGTLKNQNTGKLSNIDLHKAIQPANENTDAYIYNLLNSSAWKNGFESVKTTKVAEGYKIELVIKAEKADSEKGIAANYHNGLVSAVSGEGLDLGMDGGESIIKADMGKTTVTAVVDENCRLVSYDVNMPYSMEMNVITELDLSDTGGEDGSLSDSLSGLTKVKLEIGMKMSGSQKSSSVFTRTK